MKIVRLFDALTLVYEIFKQKCSVLSRQIVDKFVDKNIKKNLSTNLSTKKTCRQICRLKKIVDKFVDKKKMSTHGILSTNYLYL